MFWHLHAGSYQFMLFAHVWCLLMCGHVPVKLKHRCNHFVVSEVEGIDSMWGHTSTLVGNLMPRPHPQNKRGSGD